MVALNQLTFLSHCCSFCCWFSLMHYLKVNWSTSSVLAIRFAFPLFPPVFCHHCQFFCKNHVFRIITLPTTKPGAVRVIALFIKRYPYWPRRQNNQLISPILRNTPFSLIIQSIIETLVPNDFFFNTLQETSKPCVCSDLGASFRTLIITLSLSIKDV